MATTPEPTNNPYRSTPKTHGTLPLEPRVSREEKETDAAYMPQPPRPTVNPLTAADKDAGRKTTNFLNQEPPRQYDPAENIAQTPVSKVVRNEAAIPPKARGGAPTTPRLNPEAAKPSNEAANSPKPRNEAAIPPKARNEAAIPPKARNEAAIPPKARNEAAIPPKARGIVNKPISPEERMTQPPVNPSRPRQAITPQTHGYDPRTAPMTPPAGRDDTAPLAPPPPRRGIPQNPGVKPRPTVTDIPGTPGRQAAPNGYSPTMAASAAAREQSSGKGKIIGIVAGVALLLGIAGLVYYLTAGKSSDASEGSASQPVEYADNAAAPQAGQPQASASQAQPTEEAPGVGAGREEMSLFNRPLTYAGTVTPGGAASLNIILFQNGRIEGTLDYSNGKSMPVYGSYTWTDNGHKMNVNFTVSSNADKTYSESWMGSSSYIKDDLAHTLTFSRINTSTGQSMTASFALKP